MKYEMGRYHLPTGAKTMSNRIYDIRIEKGNESERTGSSTPLCNDNKGVSSV